MPEPNANPTVAATATGAPVVTVEVAGLPAGPVGDYDLLEELAQGGMGIVYKARQRNLNRTVALKMLLPGRVTTDIGRTRFQAEAAAIAELDHPNIVPIYEVGEHSGRPFFSMKLIDGGTLSDLLGNNPRPSLRQLVAILAKVCRAVHFAHQRGILHRDLKPGNVLIDAAGEPFVADFGLAKRLGADEGVTVTGVILGTPAYMAPEQAGGTAHGITTLADVYALGAILYECLTGNPPFQTRELHLLLAQIRNEEPVPPSRLAIHTPRDLETICLKCLTKDPSQRYTSAAELADDLDRWLRGEPIQARAPGLVSRFVLWMRNNSRAAVWVVLIGLAWGLFGPQLPVAISAYTTLMQNAANSMAHFPSVPTPWLLRVDWSFLPDLFWVALFVAIVLHLSVGMLIYLASRSRDRWSHLGGGAAVGLIAAVVAFTLYIGPATVLAMAVVPTIGDLNSLAAGYSKPPSAQAHDAAKSAPENQSQEHSSNGTGRERVKTPQEQLLEQYPELAAVPEGERGNLLYPKIISRNVVGIVEGIAWGMMLTLATAIPLAIGGALLAGHLVRVWGSPRAALVPYLEAYAAVSVGWLDVIMVVLAWVDVSPMPSVGVAMWVLTILAIVCPLVGVLRGWRWQDRWRLNMAAIAVVVLIYAIETDSWFRWAVFVAFTPALVLLVGQLFRRRADAATPPPTPLPVPAPADATRSFPGAAPTSDG